MVKQKKGPKRASAVGLDQIDLTPWKNGAASDRKDYEAAEALTETGKAEPDVKARPQWGSKYEFILSHIGCCIGLGNVWRFPYVCYKNGGGAFFIPYFICLATAGIPIVFLEIAIGQYFATGGISCWDVSPIFRGIGYGTTMMAQWLNVYYIVVLSWGILYLYYTLAWAGSGTLPWSTCGNPWNTNSCTIPISKRLKLLNVTESVTGILTSSTTELPYTAVGASNQSILEAEFENRTRKDPTTEFWERQILQISTGIDDVGTVQWQLALTLFLVWTACYFCIWKGVKSSGKVVYFTALFPYVMLIILFFRGVTLDNAWDGISYYITPNITKLEEPGVWVGAATQVFFSYAIALGSLTALGSYNKFDYNCYKHSLALCACDSITSFFAGFVVFSVLGFMAGELGVKVQDVAEEGPGLAFIVYPKAAAQMPLGSLWAGLFFVMLLFLGLDSQFVTMEGFFTALMDIYPRLFRKKYSKELFILMWCCIWYAIGLTMITNGGMYVFELFDNYAASGMALLWCAFWEMMCIGWFYGAERFYGDIERMIGYRINPWMKYAWKFAGPIFTMSVMIFAIARSKPLTYNRVYPYPVWAQTFGWLLAVSSMVSVPAYAIYRICRETGTLKERFKKAIRPTIKERPEALALKEREALLKSARAENMNGGS